MLNGQDDRGDEPETQKGEGEMGKEEIIEKLDNLLKVMGASSYDNFLSTGPKGHFKTILEKLETLQPSTRSSSVSSSNITEIGNALNIIHSFNQQQLPTISKSCQETYSVVSQTYKKIETLTNSTNNILLKLTNSFLPSIKNTVEQQSQIVQTKLDDQHNQLAQLGARVQKGLTREDFEEQLDDLNAALQKQLKPLGQLEALPRKVEGFLTPKFEALEEKVNAQKELLQNIPNALAEQQHQALREKFKKENPDHDKSKVYDIRQHLHELTDILFSGTVHYLDSQSEINSLEQALKEKEQTHKQELDALRVKLDNDYKGQITHLKNELQQKNQTISTQSSQITHLKNELQQQNSELQQKNQTILTQNSQITHLENALQQQNSELQQQNQALSHSGESAPEQDNLPHGNLTANQPAFHNPTENQNVESPVSNTNYNYSQPIQNMD